MSKSLCILGRQSAISLAELESIYGDKNLKPISPTAAFLDIPADKVAFDQLGGTIKLAKVIKTLPISTWKDVSKHLAEEILSRFDDIPQGKIKFGISAYGFNLKPTQLSATSLEIKKLGKLAGRSIRAIPNRETSLNAAQVLNNKLTSETGIELLIVKNNRQMILAQTVKVQNINDYAKRDRGRPKRDAKIGMLPPKLAQTIINLAKPNEGKSVLDPFCGTGVILQEALMMGFNAYGTDYDQRMIDYSSTNLEWLGSKYPNKLDGLSYLIELGDATSFKWQSFDTIACETYLGQPFSVLPQADKLNQVIRDVDTIHRKFLINVAKQTPPGFRMCIALPAWYTKNNVKHLPTLDRLTDMGYTRMSFVHADKKDLVYHRDGQIVGRELVVLIRK